jgi:hypothetical protein
MDVDSCNLSACIKKLDFLAWQDEPEEIVKFGREMYENGNWAGRVPETLHHAHWKVAYRSAKRQFFPDRDYFKDPQVWNELHEYYEAQLARTPQNNILRTCYMLVAAWSEHWDIAAEQLKKLGNKPSTRVIRDATAEMVKEIEAHAAKKIASRLLSGRTNVFTLHLHRSKLALPKRSNRGRAMSGLNRRSIQNYCSSIRK